MNRVSNEKYALEDRRVRGPHRGASLSGRSTEHVSQMHRAFRHTQQDLSLFFLFTYLFIFLGVYLFWFKKKFGTSGQCNFSYVKPV